jgi:hypothetical protein
MNVVAKPMPAVEINVPGILSWPGHADAWTDRAVTLAHTQFGIHGEKLEYLSGVITRKVHQQRRAELLAAKIRQYHRKGWRVYLRGHSNGCDVILRSLALIHGHVEAVQLIAAAADADCESNGINYHLGEGTVGRFVLCCSPNDRALWLARISYHLLNAFSAAYGSLGFEGPKHLANVTAHRVRTIWASSFDHGDWVSAAHLAHTMSYLHTEDSEISQHRLFPTEPCL